MKISTLFILMLLFSVGFLSSCAKKDWECECTTKNTFGTSTEAETYKSVKKKHAQDHCMSTKTETSNGTLVEEEDCTLK